MESKPNKVYALESKPDVYIRAKDLEPFFKYDHGTKQKILSLNLFKEFVRLLKQSKKD